jgi:hypothetical protein
MKVHIAFKVVIDGWRSEIRKSLLPGVRALIRDCWGQMFKEVIDHLWEMEFKVKADPTSVTLRLKDGEGRGYFTHHIPHGSRPLLSYQSGSFERRAAVEQNTVADGGAGSLKSPHVNGNLEAGECRQASPPEG